MPADIIGYLRCEIRRRCESESNFFGMGCWQHILAVVKNAVELAPQYGADPEIVEIAAWLHDIASITDYALYAEHHIHGAEMAKDILAKLDYDPEKTALVQRCILNHRGSRRMEKHSPEEICVADADAMSHFDAVPSLFYLAFVNRNLGIDEGTQFVVGKLERSYNKLSAQGKRIYRDKYRRVMAAVAGCAAPD